ncbi:MAG: iron-containing redox enzyme family protein [Pseudomonadota bacterium]
MLSPDIVPSDTLNAAESIAATFDSVIAEFNESPGMARFWNQELNASHWASLMREIYFHTRENPQIQALATVHFRGDKRAMVKPFLRHAISEVGHDQLALDDVAALGYDTATLPSEQPLPATTAITAYPFYQITNLNAVGYLGYLYFLEHMPTRFGPEYMKTLATMGVSEQAMSFLHDHSTIDIGHTQLMQQYIETLVTSESDLEAVRYALRTTGELYGQMVTAAFAAADEREDFGTNYDELAALAERPTASVA